MTDNILPFRKKEAVKKEIDKGSDEKSKLLIAAKALNQIVSDLKSQNPHLYFDAHIIANDRQVALALNKTISRILELGSSPDPSGKTITDHKG